MFRPTTVDETNFIALSLEGFLYGLYSGIFAMYLQYQTSKKDTTKTQNVIFYSICVLYALSVALSVVDMTGFIYHSYVTWKPSESNSVTLHITIIQTTLFGCCDFIAQFILIYRCWIVWGHNIHVVIVPSVLAFAYLVVWLVGGSSAYIFPDKLYAPYRGYSMTLLGLTLSLLVFSVFRQVKATSVDKTLGATDGNKLRHVMLVLIESGMALFSIQLARLVVTIVGTASAYKAFAVVAAIHDMLNGITPTIILVRTSMGLSFHDEKSMEEVAIESLRFVSNHSHSVSIVGQDSSDDDDVGVRRSNDIDGR